MKIRRLMQGTGLLMASIPLATYATEKPNIIVILVDDMGYSDLGCYGGEIETPHVDKLAENGLRYRQFYNTARSCPSRAMLMTGLYPHQAGMGWMAAADLGTPAYQGKLNDTSLTIAEVLQTNGYDTYMVGKWHLASDMENDGGVIDNWPNQRGFDHFYGIVGGASNYFNTVVNVDNQRVKTPADPSYYLTDDFSQKAIDFVSNHNYDAHPLFLYLAYTAPHWPLHAFDKDIAKYVERYKKGWDQLREERFERQKKMGLFKENVRLSPRDESVKAWDSLTPQEQEEYVMRMAIYAAQVEAFDRGIGQLVQKLEEQNQLDNTAIFFMSDNGACAEFISGGSRRAVDGKEDTFESYRIAWANLSSTPYREYKHYTNEGGIASPLVVHYPKGIKKNMCNTFINEYGHFTDIMPTCLDLSEGSYPVTYKSQEITPMQGVSLTPNFSGKKTNRKQTYWEHEANIAMRDGKWKIVSKTPEGGEFDESQIKLYDMDSDPTEMNDLSTKYPARRSAMYNGWKNWANAIGVFPMDTREYDLRHRTSRRDLINGEFDNNFGFWEIVNSSELQGTFTIDTENTISGKKTARIDIAKKDKEAKTAQLKWPFKTEYANSMAAVSFKACSTKKNSSLIVQIEEAGQNNAILKRTISLTPDVSIFDLGEVNLPKNKFYQLVFYVGDSDQTTWIDDVKLTVTEIKAH